MKARIFTLIVILIYCTGSSAQVRHEKYVPADQKLYDAIVQLDSIYFDAYNNCRMDVQEAMYSDSIEFYHDKGGLSTSKKDILEAIKKNVCGKVTRELVKGSIEVSPIKNYGAVEIGIHKFHNSEEKDAPSHAGRFVIIWQLRNNEWKITRVISLH